MTVLLEYLTDCSIRVFDSVLLEYISILLAERARVPPLGSATVVTQVVDERCMFIGLAFSLHGPC